MNYSDMVRSLAKDGNHILTTLTADKIHLFHMASALNGEASELLEGWIKSDISNVAEELGDLEFYAEGTRQVGKTEYCIDDFLEQCWVPDYAADVEPDMPVMGIVIAAGKIYDIVKKYVVYNKTSGMQDALYEAFREYEYWMRETREFSGLTYDQVRDANMAKLAKRYGADFQYTDAAAQNRADKQ